MLWQLLLRLNVSDPYDERLPWQAAVFVHV